MKARPKARPAATVVCLLILAIYVNATDREFVPK